ncbi:MAG: hypothetical protein JF564_05090, partial [Sphingomonas sp.]|nr:hypothetical protein [Sphingomonas sp.]
MKLINAASRIALAAALAGTTAGAALAQNAPAATAPAEAATGGAESGEIIVTARKRDETLIAVPVVVTAVGGATL